jgi:hypothetical protein
MNQYTAAPQKRKKMKLSLFEKTIDFSKVPNPSSFGRTLAWASGDVIEFMGLRPGWIVVGFTAEVVKPTTSESKSGHTITVLDTFSNSIGWFRTGNDGITGRIVEYYGKDSGSGMENGLFFSPIEAYISDTIDLKISHAFTTGRIKITLYIMEEDRS